jgi:serine/threonine protein kinase
MQTETANAQGAATGLLEIGLELGLLDDGQVNSVRSLQRSTQAVGIKLPLGQTLLERKYLTPFQLKEVRQELVRRVTRKETAPAAHPHARVGGFEIVEVLSEKDRSSVYKARDTAMNRMVVLKLLPPDMARDPQWSERFRREVEIAARLVHPNIAAAYGAGTLDGRPYLTMEYIDGMSLGERLEREGNLPEKSAWSIAREVVKGLAFADLMGVLHRDVKPENIVFGLDGKVKIIDMGFSKVRGESQELTAEGTTVGTPFYISPEQARGETKLDIRSDLYSLGCTVYQMLTGAVPFYHENFLEVMRDHTRAPRPDPRTVLPEICEGSARLVIRMLSIDKSRRLRPDDLLAEIDALLPQLPEPVDFVRPEILVDASHTAQSAAIKGDPELAPERPKELKAVVPGLFQSAMCCAIELGLLSSSQVESLRNQRARLEQVGISAPVGATLLGRGYLKLPQLEQLCALLRQRGYGKPSTQAPRELRFDVYNILRVLSSKEHSIVYLAHNRVMKRDVALRVLPKAIAADADRMARFDREVQLLAKLVHPNIATAYESGQFNGCPFMSTEFVDGITLAERLEREGHLSERIAWKVALEVAKGLAFASQHGIVHRDIKPDNIICGFDGQVKIIDFGLSKTDETNDLTVQGTTVGTPWYIAPEQARGTKSLDPRSDIYSLGCTIFQMLTGALPFYNDQFFEVMRAHTEAPRPDPRQIAPHLSADSARLLQGMMAIHVDVRPESMDELIKHIENLLSILPVDAPKVHVPPAPRPASAPKAERHPPSTVTDAVAVALPPPTVRPAPKSTTKPTLFKRESVRRTRTAWERFRIWLFGR